MIQKLRERTRGEGGFTLVELLVVMLILGLLAAIAIPSFFNQRDKANDADAKSHARTAQTAMETFATDNAGSYAAANATPTALTDLESTLNDAQNLTVTSDANTYTVSVESSTGNVFGISRETDGTTSLTCGDGTLAGEGGKGGCPDNKNWGGE